MSFSKNIFHILTEEVAERSNWINNSTRHVRKNSKVVYLFHDKIRHEWSFIQGNSNTFPLVVKYENIKNENQSIKNIFTKSKPYFKISLVEFSIFLLTIIQETEAKFNAIHTICRCPDLR